MSLLGYFGQFLVVRRKALLLCILFSVAGSSLSGQSSEATNVLQSAILAHGGETLIQKLSYLELAGTWHSIRKGNVRSATFLIHGGNDGQIRAVFSGPSFHRDYVTDGNAGWIKQNGRTTFLRHKDVANRTFELSPILGILREFSDNRLVLKQGPARTTQRNRVAAYLEPEKRLIGKRAVTASERRYDIELDSRLGSRLRTDQIFAADAFWTTPEPVLKYVYLDYQSWQGCMVPFRIQVFDQDQLFAEVELDSIRESFIAPNVTKP